jgi:hypothetical protein
LADGVTAVTATMFVLFPKFGSYVPELSVAVFVSGPLPGAV